MAQTQIKKLVGRIDDSYYVCDTLFEHADDLKGATATVLEPVSLEEYERRTKTDGGYAIDYFRDIWGEAAGNGSTEEGLYDFVATMFASHGDEAVFDFSGYEYWDMLREAVPELTEEDYPVFECSGGGRSFSPDMEWDKIYDESLWQQIKAIETN